jgi:hypothetical protein
MIEDIDFGDEYFSDDDYNSDKSPSHKRLGGKKVIYKKRK